MTPVGCLEEGTGQAPSSRAFPDSLPDLSTREEGPRSPLSIRRFRPTQWRIPGMLLPPKIWTEAPTGQSWLPNRAQEKREVSRH